MTESLPPDADPDLLAEVASALAAMYPIASGQVRPDCVPQARVALVAAGRWLSERQSGWGFVSSEEPCCKETAAAAADLISHRTGAS